MPVVTVFGGSGFIGRYVVQRLAAAGWRIRVVTRHRTYSEFLRVNGNVGQVFLHNIPSLEMQNIRLAIQGSDAVVNCIGIMRESRKQTFDKIHAVFPDVLAECIKENSDIKKFVHISALGAGKPSKSSYITSKTKGETSIFDRISHATVLRPSVVFGSEDRFFNRLAAIASVSPVLPIVCGRTKFQPVYVADVARAVHAIIVSNEGTCKPVYELGGPEILTMQECMMLMLKIIRRKRLLLTLPTWYVGLIASSLDGISRLSGRLIPNTLITKDRVKLLLNDNIVGSDYPNLQNLGIEPVALQSILPSYLYSYRPYAQFYVEG
jgi:NADH dehydrogenase